MSEEGAFETTVDLNGPVRGRYLEIDPPRRVVVSWGVAGSTGLPPGATRVEFTLTPTEAGTRLRRTRRPVHGTGWRHFLAGLGRAAAGEDPGTDPWGRG